LGSSILSLCNSLRVVMWWRHNSLEVQRNSGMSIGDIYYYTKFGTLGVHTIQNKVQLFWSNSYWIIGNPLTHQKIYWSSEHDQSTKKNWS
jgi:hypothetical protein